MTTQMTAHEPYAATPAGAVRRKVAGNAHDRALKGKRPGSNVLPVRPLRNLGRMYWLLAGSKWNGGDKASFRVQFKMGAAEMDDGREIRPETLLHGDCVC